MFFMDLLAITKEKKKLQTGHKTRIYGSNTKHVFLVEKLHL